MQQAAAAGRAPKLVAQGPHETTRDATGGLANTSSAGMQGGPSTPIADGSDASERRAGAGDQTPIAGSHDESCEMRGGIDGGSGSGRGSGRGRGSFSYPNTDSNVHSIANGEKCAALVREAPAFLIEAVGLTGSLRSLASCQAVNRAWHHALGGDRGDALFGRIVRSSGVPARLRPAVWQTLVLRTVAVDRPNSVGSGRGSSGEVLFCRLCASLVTLWLEEIAHLSSPAAFFFAFALSVIPSSCAEYESVLLLLS